MLSEKEMDDFYIKEEEVNITDVSDLEDENEGGQKEQDGTDFLIHTDEEWHAIVSSVGQNPHTSAWVGVANPPDLKFYDNLIRFRKGYTMFALAAYWGRVDQMCLRLWRVIRLIVALSMIKPFESGMKFYKALHVQFMECIKEVKREETRHMQRYQLWAKYRRRVINPSLC